MFTISIDTSKLINNFETLLNNIEKEVRIGLKESAQLLIDQARTELNGHFNHISGKAEQSIQIDESKTANTSITVGLNNSTAFYSKYLHEGTKDHMVKPKDAKALSWMSGGNSFISKGHVVSGIEKFQFLYIAAEKVKKHVIEIITSKIENAIKLSGLK